MDANSLSGLGDQVAALRLRVGVLEDALRAYGIVVADSAAVPIGPRESVATQAEPPAAPTPETNFETTSAAAPLLNSFTVPRPEADRSLESRIASQWFNRIGILAVLVGMAWFLKLAIDNHWIGPLGRVVIGLIAGAGLIAWSERFHKRGYPAFSYSLKAVGSGILYLSLWAAFSLFHLLPAAAAFAAMATVTAFNGWMSWRENSELLALYSIVGGLSTPLLVSTGGNHEVSLFSYLLLLNCAVFVLTLLRPWSRLLFGAFSGTVLFILGWFFSYYSNDQFGRTTFFLLCFFLLFGLAPRLIRFSGTGSHATPWDVPALLGMPIANAAVIFLLFFAMLNQRSAEWTQPWLAVAFAGYYLMLQRLSVPGPYRNSPAVVSRLHLAMAVIFLSIAIPLKAHGWWLTIGWLVEGAALLWAASRTKPLELGAHALRILALLVLSLGLGVLLLRYPHTSFTPILNARFGTYLVAIAVFTFTAVLARRAAQRAVEPEADPALRWTAIAAAAALLVNVLILLALSWEIHNYWWFNSWHGRARDFHDYRIYAQFSYSALFMGFGAVLLGAGFSLRSPFVRWQALVLLAAAIGKVFLVDVSELSQGYRVISFLGLGALLLGVSFVYQRDWLQLRASEGELP